MWKIPFSSLGLGVGALALLLPYALKEMPQFLAWAGLGFALAFIIIGLIPIIRRPSIPILILGVAIFVFAGGALGYFFTSAPVVTTVSNPPSPKPKLADIGVTLITEKKEKADLRGRFLFENKSDTTVTITALKYETKTFPLFSNSVSILLQPREKRPFSVKTGNGLIVSQDDIYLYFSYKFDGYSQMSDGCVTFQIPANLNEGAEILSSEYCGKRNIDLKLRTSEQFSFMLRNSRANALQLVDIPHNAKFLLGDQGGRQIVVDMPKTVAFLVPQNGKQKVLLAYVSPTLNGQHTIDVYWDDDKNRASMMVDGIEAIDGWKAGGVKK